MIYIPQSFSRAVHYVYVYTHLGKSHEVNTRIHTWAVNTRIHTSEILADWALCIGIHIPHEISRSGHCENEYTTSWIVIKCINTYLASLCELGVVNIYIHIFTNWVFGICIYLPQQVTPTWPCCSVWQCVAVYCSVNGGWSGYVYTCLKKSHELDLVYKYIYTSGNFMNSIYTYIRASRSVTNWALCICIWILREFSGICIYIP